jgi:hypothetical protein
MDSVPEFSCGSSPCISIPETPLIVVGSPDRYSRVIRPGNEFFIDKVGPIRKCSQIDSAFYGNTNPPTTTLSNNDYKCDERNGNIIVKFLNSNICTTNCWIKFKFQLTLPPPASSPNVEDILSLKIETNGPPSLEAYKLIFNMIGHEDILSSIPTNGSNLKNGIDSIQTFFESHDGENRHFGLLAQVREFFQPGGIGGLFNQYYTSTAISGKSANVAFWDEGIFKSFKIDVESDNAGVPAYLKDDDAPYPAPTGVHTSFTNKITFSRILGGAFIPETIIRWIHGMKVGSLEHKSIELKNGIASTDRSLIYWNTELPDHGRFEVYSYQKEMSATSPYTVLSQKTSFLRAERESTVGEGNARLESFYYDSKKDNTSNIYDQKAGKSAVILKNDKALYLNTGLEATQNSGGPNLFERPGLSHFRESKSFTSTRSSALSPDGTHFISSWAEQDANNEWEIQIFRRNNSTVTREKIQVPSAADKPVIKVSINNAGEAVVAYMIKNSSTSYHLHVISKDDYDLSSWVGDQTFTLNTGNIPIGSTPSITSSEKIEFDLIESNPTSLSSTNKFVVYSNKSIVRKLSSIKFNSSNSGFGSWSTTPVDIANDTHITNQVTHLSIIKVDPSSYHVSWIYETSSTDFKMKSLTSSLESSSPNDISTAVSVDTIQPKNLISIYNSAIITDLYVQLSDGSIKKFQYDSDVPSISSNGLISSVKAYESSPYCFARIRTGARPTLNAGSASSCNLPDSSYAPAIRSSVLIDTNNDGTADIDAGFKHDIQSLNPETFKYIFTMP